MKNFTESEVEDARDVVQSYIDLMSEVVGINSTDITIDIYPESDGSDYIGVYYFGEEYASGTTEDGDTCLFTCSKELIDMAMQVILDERIDEDEVEEEDEREEEDEVEEECEREDCCSEYGPFDDCDREPVEPESLPLLADHVSNVIKKQLDDILSNKTSGDSALLSTLYDIYITEEDRRLHGTQKPSI